MNATRQSAHNVTATTNGGAISAPSRGTRVEPPNRHRTLAARKPFGDGLDTRGNSRRFGESKQSAKNSQPRPTGRECMQHVGHRPRDGEQRETRTQSDAVDDEARDRLHDRVSQLKRTDDVAVLLGAHRKRHFQLRREHAQ